MNHRFFFRPESIEEYGNPYALLACAPKEKIILITSTSGTTGMPTLYTLTRHEIEVVNETHASVTAGCPLGHGDSTIYLLIGRTHPGPAEVKGPASTERN